MSVLFCWLLVFYGRYLSRVEDHAMAVFAALCLWVMFSIHDMAVTLRVFSGPYLLGLGYAAFLTAFSMILVKRFVRSSADVERWAETLQRLVDERTAELRQKEVQLADGQRLATLSTLAASCAHELNNPAAYVTSSLNRLAELWKRGAETGDAGEFDEILTECREGVERIRKIVGDLVALAQRSDGERERIDLREVVEGALPVARNEARYRAEIVTSLAEVPPVRGDARLLGQVVIQLVLNGIQAAASGSSPRPRVGVETSFEDGSVWLVVRDNGPGIPAELRPRLFDPFFPGRTEGDRVGFGLAVTHQIVSSHQGRIDVESGDAGTTMIVELPAALVFDAHSVGRAPAGRGRRRRRGGALPPGGAGRGRARARRSCRRRPRRRASRRARRRRAPPRSAARSTRPSRRGRAGSRGSRSSARRARAKSARSSARLPSRASAATRSIARQHFRLARQPARADRRCTESEECARR